ncbi:STAS domain-containing protein [Gordonia sp. TBRC 11910]|uniref:STAS domain-containing protein n=1 Tax=Gordonia asplenii TaxID=2725283 RepID=A0A848KUD2_9ACTN|nr:STAS domain-containing protein [Gordonia asplenii]NMO01829.1 STAS domain-containing protein [Gordonia asplenii]
MLLHSDFDHCLPSGPAQIDICLPPPFSSHQPILMVVTGEIDASNIDLIGSESASLLLDPADIALDLRAVTFMSAGGLQLLMELSEFANSHGVECAVITSPPIDRLLNVLASRPSWAFSTFAALQAHEVFDNTGTG